MKKKIITVAIGALTLALLAGCGEKSDTYTDLMEGLSSKVTTLGNYKGLTYEKEETAVSDEEIEEEIQMELESYSEYKEIERTTVEDGDVVNINFAGRVGDELFEGGTAEDFDLEIGSGDFIDGFEEQIIGKEKGSTFDINVTFPQDYEESLAGKDAVFEVTVNKIQEAVPAELNDAFVKENMDCDTVEEYRQSVKDDLAASKEEDAVNGAIYQLLDQIVESTELEVKDADIKQYVDDMIANYKSYADMYGMETEEFISSFFGCTTEELKEQSKNDAKEEITYSLILSEIAKKENLGITQEEYEAEVKENLEEYECENIEEFEKEYDKGEVIYTMLYDKVTNYLLEHAKNSAE